MFGFSRRSTPPTTSPVPLTARPAEVETRADPNDAIWDALLGVSGQCSVAGPDVGPISALHSPAVRACFDVICGSFSTLPLRLYQRTPDGGSTLVSDHPAVPLVEQAANPWTAPGELIAQLVQDALQYGAGYGYVVKDADGVAQEIIRLLPTAVIVEIDPLTSEPRFRVTMGNAANQVFDWQNIIFIRPVIKRDTLATGSFSSGYAPVVSGKDAIGVALAEDQHIAQILGRGGRPSGILSFPQKLGATVAGRIKASWQSATSGRAAGGTAILEENGKFQPLSFTAADQQFQEGREYSVLQASRLFGVPPPFLGDHGRATWANYEQSSRQLVQFCLQPWARAIEAAFNRSLLSAEDRRKGLSFGFDFDALLEGDLAARAAAYSTMISARILNPNEAREKEGLAPYAEGSTFTNPNTSSPAPIDTSAGPNGGDGG